MLLTLFLSFKQSSKNWWMISALGKAGGPSRSSRRSGGLLNRGQTPHGEQRQVYKPTELVRMTKPDLWQHCNASPLLSQYKSDSTR